jgi:signal transduction histidine kinase
VSTGKSAEIAPAIGSLSSRIAKATLLTIIGFIIAQLLNYDYRSSLPEARIDIDEIYFKQGASPEAPDSDDYGKRLSLPHNWREAGHPINEDEGTGWYTSVIRLNVPPNRLWVIYFPNISANSTVYLNNEVLGHGIKLNDRLGQMRQRPLYLNIPNGILHSDENILQIYIESGHAFYGSIEPFYLGPEVDFKDVYSNQYFFEITLVKVIGILMFFSAIGNGIIWLLRKQETLNGWFALGCLLWSLHILSHFIINTTWYLSYLEYLFRYMSITWFAAILMVIVNRYQQTYPVRREKIVFTVATIICVILPFIPANYFNLLSNSIVGAFALAMIAYSYVCLVLNQKRAVSLTDFFIAMAISIIFFLSVNDLISTVTLTERKYTGMTAHYGAPFLVIVLSWKLIRDFVGARDAAEELNRTLEARVEEKTRELEDNFARMRAMEDRNLLAKERDRLIMDMHDGLGAQLVSAASMLDHGQFDRKVVSDTIKDALTDLRAMINAFDPVCDDLAMALGSFRNTLEKSLQGTGIKLVWDVHDTPVIDDMNPHIVLQILRILQEAVSNAIKYSNATEVAISSGSDNGRAFLRVTDNGVGFKSAAGDDERNNGGRGLQNMQRRAAMINAELHLSCEKGVSVQLLFNNA